MDTAFYNRTGFTSVWSFSEVNFYPKSSWLQRIHPFYFAKYGRDRIQNGDEDYLHTGIRFNVTRQGFLNFSHGRGHESWKGTKYRIGSDFNFFGNMQPLRWLSLFANYGGGPAIFYDEIAPFQGRSRNYGVEVDGAAEPAPVAESRVRPQPLLAARDRRRRLRRQHRQFAHDLPVRQALSGAAAGALRQLAAPRIDRLPGVLRVRARNGVSCRVRVAVQKGFGSGERGARGGNPPIPAIAT